MSRLFFSVILLAGLALLSACGVEASAGTPPSSTPEGRLRPVVSTSLAVNTGRLVTPVPSDPRPTSEPVAVRWERSGGLSGVCWQMDLGYSGAYRLQDCRREETAPAEGILDPADLELVLGWLNAYKTFAWEAGPVSTDGFADRYQFNGQGSSLPSAEEQVKINEALSGLAIQLRPPPSPTPAGGSGISGLALIGPACPGPVRVDQPCPDQPYPAQFLILDSAGRVVTRIQADAKGNFQAALPAGTYTLHPEVQDALPRADDLPFTVYTGEYTPVEIHFDSGIR